MSNAGQALLTIAGTAVGFAIPGVGPLLGFYAGNLLGNVLFPTQLDPVEGPRLKERDIQSVEIGVPIPIVYGTFALAGNVIWSSGVIETQSTTTQGGKGSPEQEQTTYSYQTNVAIGICEGEVSGVRRIWANGAVIYDVRAQQPGETTEAYNERLARSQDLADNHMTFYTGSVTQTADPTIESWVGSGFVPGMRGLCYCVFYDLQLADYGNRIPSFRFEIPATEGTEYSGDIYPEWGPGNDPRLAGYVYEYMHQSDPVAETYSGPTDWVSSPSLIYDSSNWASGRDWSTYISYTSSQTDADLAVIYGFGAVSQGTADPADRERVILSYNRVDTGAYLPFGGAYGTSIISAMNFAGLTELEDVANPRWPVGVFGNVGNIPYCIRSTFGSFTPPDSGFHGVISGSPTYMSYQLGIGIYCRRTIQAPVDEERPWTLDTSGRDFKRLANIVIEGVHPSVFVSQYQVDPTIADDDPRYNDEAFWTTAYNGAVSNGQMEPGLIYGVDYPVALTGNAYVREGSVADPNPVALSTIVEDICGRCSLTPSDIGVADLQSIYVPGYAVTRQMSGRAAIEPLRVYGYFDGVESEGFLKFPTRGKSAVATLTLDDLAAHPYGEQRPSSVEVDRTQDVELPRKLYVRYILEPRDYEPGQQYSPRLTTEAVNEVTIDVPVVMTDGEGLSRAETLLYERWTARSRYKFSLDASWLRLDPSDAIVVPVDRYAERLRITGITHVLPTLLQIEAVKDDDGIYEASALAPVTGGRPSGQFTFTGETELVLLDLPALRDVDDDAGYYAAVRGEGNGWHGASIYISSDGGSNYTLVGSISGAAIIGEVAEALPAGLSTTWDEGNELVITVPDGATAAFSNATEESIFIGANLAAIGVDGRWELVQFHTATYDGDTSGTWRLSGLLRGRKGTEWAIGTSVLGDAFVLLTQGGVLRIGMDMGSIGAVRPHKAVSFGGTLVTTTPQNFTGNGVALEPYSVIDVEGERDESDNLAITWIRRGRLGRELMSGVDIPLSEASEAYEIDIMDGVTVERTLTSSSQTVFYSAAQQTTDFGSPQSSVTVRIYQMSAVVGRGYVTEATV